MRKLFANPYLLLTLTVLSWSGNMVIGRGIRGDIPPLTLAFWRWVIAFLLVLPLALPHLKTQWPLLKKCWRPLLVLGLLGVGGCVYCGGPIRIEGGERRPCIAMRGSSLVDRGVKLFEPGAE